MKHSIILIATLLALASCQKKESTTTGNPLVSLSMTSSQNTTAIALNDLGDWLMTVFLPQVSAAAPNSLVDLAGNTLTLDHGWMVVKEIEFKESEIADGGEIDGAEVELSGPFVVGLFGPTPDKLGTADVSLKSIRRIKMQLHNLESISDSAPQELLNSSIYFSGDIGGKAFSISSKDGAEFEIGGPNALNVQENMNLLVSIRIIPLINKINLTYLLSQSSPVVINDSSKGETGTAICPQIDASSTTIYDCFRKGLQQQANLGADQDGSGELEADESEVK